MLLHVRALAIGGAFDDVRVRLEQFDAQQTVVVRRLLGRGNAKPQMVGVEGVPHRVLPAILRPQPFALAYDRIQSVLGRTRALSEMRSLPSRRKRQESDRMPGRQAVNN